MKFLIYIICKMDCLDFYGKNKGVEIDTFITDIALSGGCRKVVLPTLPTS